MLFDGNAIKLEALDDGLVELRFDLQNASVNKFCKTVFEDLQAVTALLEKSDNVKGLLVTSAKKAFFVGADISEFGPMFKQGKAAISEYLNKVNALFNRVEGLPFPTVAAINGYCLGGGLECVLSCDFRVLDAQVKIGFPETRLGIIPGWGGTVRLPRIAGVDVAAEWIAGARENSAEEALKVHVADAVVEPGKLRDVAITMLKSAVEGKLDYARRRAVKQSPLPMNDTEALMAFETAKMFVKQQAGRHYPAPVAAVQSMQDSMKLARDEALQIETRTFAEMAATPVAFNLVGLFLSDQILGKKAKEWEKKSNRKISTAAVLGAGIMGGGIAYQSACKGIPIKMKDVAQAGIDLGLGEAAKLLTSQVARGKITHGEMAQILTRIDPMLSYDHFADLDVVVEAVIENPKIKKVVLREVEEQIGDDTVLSSNTSTISISQLAEGLKRPENFCGMHFFNPVHRMPLVEVIRGKQTSDMAIARTVAYANALGKKAVVVNDCPGFFVNRVLFPYFAGFAGLVRDGADFQEVDKVMERWGWPMGPAYLMDVVGIDTGVHAQQVMAEGFPDRMGKTFKSAADILFETKRFGQKSECGFYQYSLNKKGKLEKNIDESVYALLAPHCAARQEFTKEEIIARMILPMAIETARCLEENIVESAAEADMALIYGLGFPPFRGGIFRWMDDMGMPAVLELAAKYKSLGAMYASTEGMASMRASTYYQNS